jgi:hypothetical protein
MQMRVLQPLTMTLSQILFLSGKQSGTDVGVNNNLGEDRRTIA